MADFAIVDGKIVLKENLVEVVRCKDCIYYYKGDWYDDDVCKVHSNDDRGYCAWGERK